MLRRRLPLDLDPLRGLSAPRTKLQSARVGNGTPTAPQPFRFGWFATSGARLPAVVAQWRETVWPGLRIRVHPERTMTGARHGDHRLLLIGDALDTDHHAAGQVDLLAELLSTYVRDGEEPLIRRAAYLDGRFLLLAVDGRRSLVVPDTAATIPAHWIATPTGTVTLSSHAALVAQAEGLGLDDELLSVLADARRESPYVIYPPGVRGYHPGVRPLLANHVLRWEGSSVRHERFYPFPETVLEPEGYPRFAERFAAHLRLLARDPVRVALTGGADSRATFAGVLRVRGADVSAWTWSRGPAAPEAERLDVAAARAAAEAAGTEHRVVTVSRARSGRFGRAIRTSFPAATQDALLAEAVWRGIPSDATSLVSFIAEVGTGFYKVRTAEPIDAARLARVYSSRPVGRSDYAIDAFDEFTEYAGFREAAFGPWDPHDLLYWEHRLPLWAAARVQELELGHRIMLPFNSRRVLEALAAAPWETRQAKSFLHRFSAELA